MAYSALMTEQITERQRERMVERRRREGFAEFDDDKHDFETKPPPDLSAEPTLRETAAATAAAGGAGKSPAANCAFISPPRNLPTDAELEAALYAALTPDGEQPLVSAVLIPLIYGYAVSSIGILLFAETAAAPRTARSFQVLQFQPPTASVVNTWSAPPKRWLPPPPPSHDHTAVQGFTRIGARTCVVCFAGGRGDPLSTTEPRRPLPRLMYFHWYGDVDDGGGSSGEKDHSESATAAAGVWHTLPLPASLLGASANAGVGEWDGYGIVTFVVGTTSRLFLFHDLETAGSNSLSSSFSAVKVEVLAFDGVLTAPTANPNKHKKRLQQMATRAGAAGGAPVIGSRWQRLDYMGTKLNEGAVSVWIPARAMILFVGGTPRYDSWAPSARTVCFCVDTCRFYNEAPRNVFDEFPTPFLHASITLWRDRYVVVTGLEKRNKQPSTEVWYADAVGPATTRTYPDRAPATAAAARATTTAAPVAVLDLLNAERDGTAPISKKKFVPPPVPKKGGRSAAPNPTALATVKRTCIGWRPLPPLPRAATRVGLVAVNDSLFVIGLEVMRLRVPAISATAPLPIPDLTPDTLKGIDWEVIKAFPPPHPPGSFAGAWTTPI